MRRPGQEEDENDGYTQLTSMSAYDASVNQGQEVRASSGHLPPEPQSFERYSASSVQTVSIFAEPYQPSSFGQGVPDYEDINVRNDSFSSSVHTISVYAEPYQTPSFGQNSDF